MSRNFTKMAFACLSVLLCLGGEINAQKKMCLKEIKSDMEGDYTYYGYNKDGSLDSVYQYKSFYDVDSYRLYKYDEKGNMISEEGFAILPHDGAAKNEYSMVFRVLYGFDDMNRLSTRTNYNIDEYSADLSFILGGVYEYVYDSKGLMSQRKLYWDEAKTDLYERVDYTYNDKNLKVKEVYVTFGFDGVESQDMMVEFYYDEKGRNVKVSTNTMDYNTGALVQSGTCFYEYDEKDNLVSRTSYDLINPEIPNEKHILLYNDTLTGDVAFPINYEDDMDFFVNSKHVAVQDSIYKRDVEGDVFLLFDVQNWNYKELEGSTGIENVAAPEQSICFRRDSEGNILIGGLQNSECIRIYDASGRMVRSEMYSGMVRTDNLPNGMYILMTRNGNMKFSKK